MQIEQEDYRVNGKHFNRVMLATILVTIAFVLLASVLLKVFSPVRFGERRARSLNQPDEINGMHLSLFETTAPGLSLNATKRRALQGYSWADSGQTQLRIPIADAMQLYLAEHAKPGPSPSSPADASSPPNGGAGPGVGASGGAGPGVGASGGAGPGVGATGGGENQ